MHTHRTRTPRALGFSLSRLSSAAAVCAALAGFSTAKAQTNTWTAGSGADLLWDTGTNWSLGAEPLATDDVLFPTPIPNPGTLPTPGTITLTAGEVAKSLTFRDAYTLTGGDLTLGVGGMITVAPTFTATINSALIGANGLTLAGSNGLVAPDDQAGGGTLVLGGTNTYSGVTTINSGVLSISSSANLGDGSATNTITLGGGTLRNTGTSVDLGVNRAVTLTASSTIDATPSTALTISGPLSSGAGNTLNKIGTGTLTIGGGALDTTANTTAGAVRVTQGLLELNKAAGTNAIGTGGLVINSAGATGTAAANAAVARLLAANQIDDTASVTVATGGSFGVLLDLNDFNETIAGLSVTGSTVNGSTVRTGANGVLTVNGNITLTNERGAAGNTGREVLITGTGVYGTAAPSGTLDLGGGVRTITVQSNNTQLNSDATIETVIQNGGIIKEGSRVLHLRNANTFAGGLTVNNGLVSFNADDRLGAAGNVITLNGGGVSWAGGATTYTLARTLNIGSNGGILDVAAAHPSKILITQDGLLTGAGNIVTKTGAGTLQITAAQTGIGGFNVAGGILEVSADNALTTNAVAVTGGELVASNRTVGNTVNITSGRLSVNNGNSGVFAGTINANGDFSFGLRDFQATTVARNATISGNLVGSGNMTIVANTNTTPAAATLTLTGDNSAYTGTITVPTNQTVVMATAQNIGDGGFDLRGGTVRTTAFNATGSVAGAPGLLGTYFNFGSGAGSAVNADIRYATDQLYITPRAFSRNDATINIPNSPGAYPIVPVPGFAVNNATQQVGAMWKGLLNITTGGTYNFNMGSDDGSVLYIDGQLVVNNDGGHGFNPTAGAANGSITLSPGAHSIVVKWGQGTGSGAIVLNYTGADTGGNEVLVGSVANSVNSGMLTGTVDLGPLTVTSGTNTVDFTSDSSAPSLTVAGGTLTVTSPTLSSLTITGASTLTGVGTLAPTTAPLIFNGAIGDGGAGVGLNIAGPYITQFNATNSYTGTTTVTGGQLQLNAAGGTSIAGDLTVNSPNTLGQIVNVKVMAPNQIGDGSTLTVTSGNYDQGAHNDTIGTLVMNGGNILGSGTLTATNFDLRTGSVAASLAGAGPILKNTPGRITLSGNSSYTAVTAISDGVLRIESNNALGAAGAGNETNVLAGGTLEFAGNLTSGEAITVAGTGSTVNGASLGALRNIGGANRLTTGVTLAGDTLIRSASGNLMLDGVLTGAGANLTVDGLGTVTVGNVALGGGAITKNGAGTLTFTVPQSAAQLAAVVHNAGTLGFSGPQSFGAVSVPAGRAYQFNSDPGAGVAVTVPTDSTVIGGYAIDNTFLSRLASGSSGVLAITGDLSNNLDFSANGLNVSLGATGINHYSGTITPNGGVYRFGGGGGKINVDTTLTGNNGLGINGDVQLFGPNTFTGAVSLNAGRLTLINNDQLGNGANVITLNGGSFSATNITDATGFGSGHNRVDRFITVGAAGGSIHVPNRSIAAFNLDNQFTGAGTLTKTGFGELSLVGNNTAFTGEIVLSPNSNVFDIRAGGRLTSASRITVEQSATLRVHNNSGVGLFGINNNGDRIGNSIPITLNGGNLTLEGLNGTGSGNNETVGTVTLGVGQAGLNLTRTGGGGADLTVANLVTTGIGSTVRVGGSHNTLGSTGDNARLRINQINGVAFASGDFAGGGLTVFGTNWAAQGANGLVVSNGTNQGTGTFTPVAGTRYNFNATGTLTLADSGSNEHVMQAFRFGSNGAQTLAFTDANDTLYVTSGGILSDGSNQSRTIGATALRGNLTAGAPGASTPQQLFLHNNSNTLSINSVIINNPGGGSVAVVKDVDGAVNLNAANTYSGGTYILRGNMQASNAGAFGTGNVLVKNARATINAPGSINAAAGTITATDEAEIFINNSGGNFTQASDRFIVSAGSILMGSANGTGGGLGSLTRVSGAPTAGGQVQLAPGSIVGHNTNTINGEMGTGLNTIQNLGIDADLFFGLSNTTFNAGANQSVTVGPGTPWMGISTDRGSRTWSQGTIYATGDFTLQGLARDTGFATLTFGAENSTGSYSIVNQAGQPISATVLGLVVLDEGTGNPMPSDLTFVVSQGATLTPNWSGSFGTALGNLNAEVLVQAGGTIDPGGFVPVGASANQDFGKPYPVVSPINTDMTVQPGGRLLANDASGLGSTNGGAKWTFKNGSVIELLNTSAFLGANNGLINAGQMVYEPGVLIRHQVDSTFKLGQFVSGEANGEAAIHQIYGGNRTITNQLDPFVATAVGVNRYVPEDIRIANGGGITGDSTSGRQLNEGRGRLFVGNNAFFAQTTGGELNIQESFHMESGATLFIGSDRYINGNPKTGTVRLVAPNSNLGDSTNTITVVGNGSQLAGANTNVIPDFVNVHLPTAVTGFTGNVNNDGSSLRLENGTTEFIGKLTGSGAVTATTGTSLAVGWGATTDFTFDGVIKSNNAQNPGLVKVGSTRLNLTNTSDTTGHLFAMDGEVALTGPNGRWTGGELRLVKGGTLIFDNTVDAIADRQGAGAGNRWLATAGGGEFKLLGHATQAADVTLFGLANSAGSGFNGLAGGNSGGVGIVSVVPAAGTTGLTSLTIGQMERFDNTGERNAVWLLRGPGLAGLPGTFSSTGVYTPSASNPADGLIYITTPRFNALGSYDQNSGGAAIHGAPGTPVVPVAGNLLGTTSLTATEGDFVTIDVTSGAGRTGARVLTASEYQTSLAGTRNTTSGPNIRATGALEAHGDTRFQVLKMENGSSLTTTGTVPGTVQPSQTVLTAGGLLIPSGATATVTSQGDNIFRTNNGVSLYLHAYGDVNFSGTVFSDTGLIKTGGGTATFAAGSLDATRGRLVIHDGTVHINDTLANLRNTGNGAVGFDGPHLVLNGGTLDLHGHSQMVNRFEGGSVLTEADQIGGTLRSTGGAATLTMKDGGTISGHIGASASDAISINKVGNNTLMLSNSNPTSGSVTVSQGTIVLRDLGTLPNISSIDLNFGRIDVDNTFLASANNRLNPAVTMNMRSADFVHRGRPGELTQQSFATVNVLSGTNLFQTLAGGSGASETIIGNLNRSAGATIGFQQNHGFVGAAGNTSTAIRYILNNLNNAPVALSNNIIGGWAIVNSNDFATYDSVRGIGALGNTSEGFANYDSTDVTTALATHNVNDGSSRTIGADTTINTVRHAPNAANTWTVNAALTLAGGGLLTNNNNTFVYTGTGSLTSGTSELNVFVNQNRTDINIPITGNISLVRAGSGTLRLGATNTYTGVTIANGGTNGGSAPSGTLELNRSGANGTSIVSVPGNLIVGNTTVTELIANQIAQTANVTITGGGILNLHNSAVTETLNSLTFEAASGDNVNRGIITRTAAQAGTLNLTGATPITSSNDNPVSTPTISSSLGTVNFTRAGAQTLQIASPVGTNGLAAVGLLFNSNIGTVPTGVAEGGLIKAGNGLLILNGAATSQFGNPAALTEVFNIQAGSVRVDDPNALGNSNAVTTVQNGAALYLNESGSITGSIRLKNGSRMGATITGSTLGVTGSTGFVDVPTGATVQVDAFDSFIPLTNNGNITVHHKLTGGGTINLVGVENSVGITGGGGIFNLRNAANDFSGTINVDTNAVLEVNSNAGGTGNTLGTATIGLDGGMLRVRDNVSGNYANNINLRASSFLDVDRQASGTNQTITFGTLNVGAGTHTLSTIYTTSPPLTVNGFRAAFPLIDGPGTLVKGGTRAIDIFGYAPGFSGNIAIAGPQGMSLPTSGNLFLAAGTNNLQNFTIGGFHNVSPGTTLNVANTLDISRNAGAITNGLNGVSAGELTGSFVVDASSTVTAGILRNNGILSASGAGAGTISATSIRGQGQLLAFVNDLNVNGQFVNDGATPTKIEVVGTGTVSLTTPNSTHSGGTEVQTGTLRLAPTAASTSMLGSGTVKVLGIPSSTLGANSQPVASSQATLQFDGGANAITHTGSIENSGVVRVSSGTATVSGTIGGPAAQYVPGLLEGRYTTTTGQPDTNSGAANLASNRLANNGNFGIKLEPRMGQTNVVTADPRTGWSENTVWIYTGEFFDADGFFTFAENIDDTVLVSIDGVDVLRNNSLTTPHNTTTSTATTDGQRGTTFDTAAVNSGTGQGLDFGMGANNDGWHTIEIRFFNGASGGGAGTTNGWAANFGFGLNTDGTMVLDGSQFSRPIDPGDGSLFRTKVSEKGSIQVDAGSMLNAGAINQTARVTLNGGAGPGSEGRLNLTGATASSADLLEATGSAGGTVDIIGSLTVQSLSVSASGRLSVNENNSGTLTVTGAHTLGASAVVEILGGLVEFDGTGGDFSAVVNVMGGTASVDGSLTASVNVDGGTLGGNGSIIGAVTAISGTIAPGNSPGSLDTGTIDIQAPATLSIEIGGSPASGLYDQVNVTGGISLAGDLQGSLINGFIPTIGDTFYIMLNDGIDDVMGTFAGIDEGATINFSGIAWTVTYAANGHGDAVFNDVALVAQIPEPSSLATLLGGLGALVGLQRFRRRR